MERSEEINKCKGVEEEKLQHKGGKEYWKLFNYK
jgi:hypothetical protein